MAQPVPSGEVSLPGLPPALPQVPEVQAQGAAGLPALDSLGTPLRSFSAASYGYQPLLPGEFLAQAESVANPDDSLSMSPTGSTAAYALYGLSGFRDEAYPLGARFTFDAPVSGYFVAFPDYSAGRWRIEGPFDGDAEVSIILRGQPQGYSNFVSSSGNTYFALLFPPGNAGGTLREVSFAVNGGNQAPAAPAIYSVASGEKGVVLRWLESKDEDAADFAGYIVERAPQFGGNFAALNAQPQPWPDYWDSDPQVGESFRYRVAAVDTSDNRGYSAVVVAGYLAGAQLDPVARIKFSPRGPHLAPAHISYDMSESYDPEGEVLFDHGLDHVLAGTPLALGESGNFVLQPGSFYLHAVVKAGTRGGITPLWLQAQPQWQSSSHVLRPGLDNGAIQRAFRATPFFLPGDAQPWIAGADITTGGVCFFRQEGAETVHHFTGLSNMITAVSRPLVHAGACWISSVDGNGRVWLTRFDGNAPQHVLSVSADREYAIAADVAASADSSTRLFWTGSSDGANYYLRSKSSFPQEPNQEILATSVTGNSRLKAIYNPAAGLYDLFFVGNAATTRWIRWDAANNSIVDSFTLFPNVVNDITVAINPVNGQTCVACLDGNNWIYSSFDGVAWSAAEMANADPCETRGQLVFHDNLAYLSGVKLTGQLVLHARSGAGVWSERNTPAIAASSGESCSLAAGNSPGILLTADGMQNAGALELRLLELGPGDVDTSLEVYPGLNWTSSDYAVAGGSDGLHMFGRNNFFFGPCEHWTSSDGESWSGTAVALPLSRIQLVRNRIGDVYLAGFNGTASEGQLYWWDSAGTSFVDQMAAVVCDVESSISLSASFFSNSVVLAGFDQFGGNLNRVTGSNGGGYANSGVPLDDTLWQGTQGTTGYYGLYGGTQPSDAAVRLISGGNALQIYSPLAESEARFMSQLQFNRYSFASTVAIIRPDLLFAPAIETEYFLSAFGLLLEPARYQVLFAGTGELESLAFPRTDLNLYGQLDLRRTVSMVATPSGNAIALICSADGEATRFEWSGITGCLLYTSPSPRDRG
jgi:hypothetical protein